MAYFEVKKGEFSKAWKKSSYAEVRNEMFDCPDDASFAINGKPVTRQDIIAHCDAIADAAYAKKCETHKEVFVSKGATRCDNTFRKVWVRK